MACSIGAFSEVDILEMPYWRARLWTLPESSCTLAVATFTTARPPGEASSKESLGAMKKTKLTRSLLAACSIVALTAVMYGCVHNGDDPEPTAEMPMPPDSASVDVTMDVALDAVQQARLLVLLPESGNSDTLTIEAGGTATRGATATHYGVEFTCDSAYPCTVTVTNSLGTILASMSTMKLPDAADPMVTASTPDPVDTFAVLNDGRTASIRADVIIDTTASPAGPTLMPTELIGMGIGGPGVLDASMAGLRSDFQANGAGFGASPGDAAAAPGDLPTLTMGTTITGAIDAIDPSADMAPAPDGWGMKTLFRDWGDTAGDGDGGFETGAIVVKNIEEGGTPHPFDGKLSGKYVNPAAQAMFALSIRADGTAPGVTTLATSVNINPTGTPATGTQWAAMVFDSTSLVAAQDQDLNVDEDETFTGSYFGAPGRFQCISMDDCALARNADGTVGVNDTMAAMGIQGSGNWSFTPDPGAMIQVPDQDWMAYGAWLTTPDDAGGDHRIGVFFNGFDPYAFEADTLTANNAAGLRGSATYSGGATGIYVDGTDSGLFTARAMLTADFDKTSDGADDTAVDYMISGRIDNFRGTDGVFLGDDTQRSPNDPSAGENDWVVMLGADELELTGAVMGSTSGSADGVGWTGMWNGQLFGPSTDAAGDAIAPSGVAGRFWAQTPDPDDTGPMTAGQTAVVGAFGADRTSN